jgi:FKBP-type peptidyl-prolyl cis-trans isomerase FkpA
VKKLALVPALALAVLAGCNSKPGDVSKIKLENDTDKTFYTMGTMLGSNLQRLELSEKELDVLYKGLKDAATGKQPEVDVAQFQPKIQEMFKERMSKASEKEKKGGLDYMTKFLAEGGQKTASGLGYKILKEGTGDAPKETDEVEVHYHGTLTNGTVFDSSVERGKTITFPLNRVIRGWTEGLQLLKPGGKIKLVIPAELGYGDAGAPPKIPGGATLVFEVELFKVVKPSAAPAAPAAKAPAPAPKKK